MEEPMPIPNKTADDLPKTAKERVYFQLKEWIIDGTLKPDERISDQEIAQYFSVSRTPIREALQLLKEQNLVCIFPGRESRIAPVNTKNICQIYHMISELHVLAVRFAYPEITEEILEELQTINRQFSDVLHSGDPKRLRELDDRFHNVFFRVADNIFLSNFAEILHIHTERVENLFFSGKPHNHENSAAKHQAIIDALKNQDPDGAMEAMRQNWADTINAFQQ